MNKPGSSLLARAGAILIGLGLVGLMVGSSIRHPRSASTFVDQPSFDLGTVAPGRAYRHSWVIENDRAVPLTLRTRFTSGRCGFSLWLGEERRVAAGGRLSVSLTCPAPIRELMPFSAIAEVRTNDVDTPALRFRVFGITGPASE